MAEIFQAIAMSGESDTTKLTTATTYSIPVRKLSGNTPFPVGAKVLFKVGWDQWNQDTSAAITSGSATISWTLTDQPDTTTPAANSGPGYLPPPSTTLGPFTDGYMRNNIVISAAGGQGSGSPSILSGVAYGNINPLNRNQYLNITVAGTFSGLSLPWTFGYTYEQIPSY